MVTINIIGLLISLIVFVIAVLDRNNKIDMFINQYNNTSMISKIVFQVLMLPLLMLPCTGMIIAYWIYEISRR